MAAAACTAMDVLNGMEDSQPLPEEDIRRSPTQRGAESQGERSEGEKGAASDSEGEKGATSDSEGEKGAASDSEGEKGAASDSEGEKGAASDSEGEKSEGEGGAASDSDAVVSKQPGGKKRAARCRPHVPTKRARTRCEDEDEEEDTLVASSHAEHYVPVPNAKAAVHMLLPDSLKLLHKFITCVHEVGKLDDLVVALVPTAEEDKSSEPFKLLLMAMSPTDTHYLIHEIKDMKVLWPGRDKGLEEHETFRWGVHSVDLKSAIAKFQSVSNVELMVFTNDSDRAEVLVRGTQCNGIMYETTFPIHELSDKEKATCKEFYECGSRLFRMGEDYPVHVALESQSEIVQFLRDHQEVVRLKIFQHKNDLLPSSSETDRGNVVARYNDRQQSVLKIFRESGEMRNHMYVPINGKEDDGGSAVLNTTTMSCMESDPDWVTILNVAFLNRATQFVRTYPSNRHVIHVHPENPVVIQCDHETVRTLMLHALQVEE